MGCKILNANGTEIIEAGSIVWEDASAGGHAISITAYHYLSNIFVARELDMKTILSTSTCTLNPTL